MNKIARGTRTYLFIILVMTLLIAILSFFLGKRTGAVTVENIATNAVIIKKIAELSSLEVQGNATIKKSNVVNDGSLSDNFKKMFWENTVNISVPYTAKYGVNLEKQELKVQDKNKKIIITLPQPQLLSYELRMDKVSSVTRQGLLQTENHEYFSKIEQKLYSQSRRQMENSPTSIERSKKKIVELLTDYYQPTGYEVEIYFGSDRKVDNSLEN